MAIIRCAAGGVLREPRRTDPAGHQRPRLATVEQANGVPMRCLPGAIAGATRDYGCAGGRAGQQIPDLFAGADIVQHDKNRRSARMPRHSAARSAVWRGRAESGTPYARKKLASTPPGRPDRHWNPQDRQIAAHPGTRPARRSPRARQGCLATGGDAGRSAARPAGSGRPSLCQLSDQVGVADEVRYVTR